MALGNTTRLGLTTWSSGDDPMGRAQFQNDNIAVENLVAVWRTGTTAARPAANAASAARSFYYSTTDGILYFTDGSDWRAINSAGAAGDVYTIVAGSVTTPQGSSSSFARSDHKHPVSTASAGSITGANGEGTSTSLARADHTHALANGVVTEPVLAANSVTRAKIDASAILKTSNSLLSFDTTNGFSVNISGTFFEAVGNAISLKAGAVTTTQLAGNIGRALLSTDVVNAAGALAFSTTNGLSVNTSATVGISSNTLIVNTNSIGPTHLTTAVAGDGLSGGNGTALAVNVDASTIETNADTLRVKDSGITVNKLAANSVTRAKIDATAILRSSSTGNTAAALTFDTTNGFGVSIDNSTIGVNGSSQLFVRNDSIGATQVDSSVYVRSASSFSASSANITISTASPTGGAAGDIWFKF